MANLSEHFTTTEMACPCCHKLPPVMFDDGHLLYCYQYQVDTLEAIRSSWGKPLIVTSWYRCPKHNKEVGGEPLSAHVFGLATDLAVSSFDEARELSEVAIGTLRDMRIGYKKYTVPTFHIDSAQFIWPRPSEFFVPGVIW